MPRNSTRILVRHGLNRLPANQKHRAHGKRWKRYEKPEPGHRLQLDVKFLERIPNTQTRLYQFTAIDECTRIRVLKVFPACNQRTAIQFMDDVVRRLPCRILVVQRQAAGVGGVLQLPSAHGALDGQTHYE